MREKDTELLEEAYTRVLSKESIMNRGEQLSIMDQTVNHLASIGFRTNKSYEDSVFMSYKPNHYSNFYAEVSNDGSVNGMDVEDFLRDIPQKRRTSDEFDDDFNDRGDDGLYDE